MNTRITLAVVGVIAAVAAILLVNRSPDEHVDSRAPAGAMTSDSAAPASSAEVAREPEPAGGEMNPQPQTERAPEAPTGDDPVAQTNDKVFKTTPAGDLIVDPHTRLNLEALIARTPPEQMGAAKQEIEAVLPASAAAKALDLIDRYVEYDLAQRQTYPPGRAPSTEEEALAELEGLSALRKAHFGPEIAQAFYGEEEALNRRLLERMKMEKDDSLTLEEKAQRAQQALD